MELLLTDSHPTLLILVQEGPDCRQQSALLLCSEYRQIDVLDSELVDQLLKRLRCELFYIF